MSYAIADQRATDRTTQNRPEPARTGQNRVESIRSPIERLHRFLENLAGGDFYGKVIVSFQNGKVHDVKIEQTKKLEEL